MFKKLHYLAVIVAALLLSSLFTAYSESPCGKVFCASAAFTDSTHGAVYNKSESFGSITDAFDFFSTSDGATFDRSTRSSDAAPGTEVFNSKTDNLQGTAYLRGLKASFLWLHDGGADGKGSLELTVKTSSGLEVIDRTFDSSDRNKGISGAKDAINNWFKGGNTSASGFGGTTDLLQAWASSTPDDPTAGNPGSLLAGLTRIGAQFVDSAFVGVGSLDILTLLTSPLGSAYVAATSDSNGYVGEEHNSVGAVAPANNVPSYGVWSITPGYGSTNLGNGSHMTSYELPIGYGYYFNGGRTGIIVNMPITMTNVDGAKSYNVAIGLGVQQYINRYWSLTPSVTTGAVGSIDLGSVSMALSAGLSSHVAYPIHHFIVGMTNAINYMTTMPITIAGYALKYNMQNWGLTNGVDGAYAFQSIPLALGVYYTNTAFVGSGEWYIPTYNETGIQIINYVQDDGHVRNRFTLSTGYLWAPHGYNGINLKFGMKF